MSGQVAREGVAHRPGPDDSEGSWAALPQRLRGRGDFKRDQGRIKDCELFYDAATEIESLRAALAKATGTAQEQA